MMIFILHNNREFTKFIYCTASFYITGYTHNIEQNTTEQ